MQGIDLFEILYMAEKKNSWRDLLQNGTYFLSFLLTPIVRVSEAKSRRFRLITVEPLTSVDGG